MEIVKNILNHCFVIDIKLATCRNENCFRDPNTINLLVDKEDAINKDVTRTPI